MSKHQDNISPLLKIKYSLQTAQSLSTLLHFAFPATIEYKLLLHGLSVSTSLLNVAVGGYELKKKHYFSGLTTESLAITSLLRSHFELQKNYILRKGIRNILPFESSSSQKNLLTHIRDTQRSQDFLFLVRHKNIPMETMISRLEVLTQSLGIGRNITELARKSVKKTKLDVANLYLNTLINMYILSRASYTLYTTPRLSKITPEDNTLPKVVELTPPPATEEEFQSPRLESLVNFAVEEEGLTRRRSVSFSDVSVHRSSSCTLSLTDNDLFIPPPLDA